jgi:hypothetical protein
MIAGRAPSKGPTYRTLFPSRERSSGPIHARREVNKSQSASTSTSTYQSIFEEPSIRSYLLGSRPTTKRQRQRSRSQIAGGSVQFRDNRPWFNTSSITHSSESRSKAPPPFIPMCVGLTVSSLSPLSRGSSRLLFRSLSLSSLVIRSQTEKDPNNQPNPTKPNLLATNEHPSHRTTSPSPMTSPHPQPQP